MACAALKRPHNFDLLANSSPEQITGSPKRRRCGAVVSSCSPANISPYLEATPKLCRDELTKNVHDEWRRMQRRRRLVGPVSPPNNATNLYVQNMFSSSSTTTSSSSSYANFTGLSPPRGSLSPSHSSMSPSHSSMSPGSMSPTRENKDQSSLTVKQVVSLCERLWKEREEKLREEYDKVLNDRLSEQYDSFLKFTQDQIMRKFQHSSCSYVS